MRFQTMDCVDSPLMRGERADVLFLQGICYEYDTTVGGTPGDGVCSLRDAAALCDDEEMDDMAALEGEEEWDAPANRYVTKSINLPVLLGLL